MPGTARRMSLFAKHSVKLGFLVWSGLHAPLCSQGSYASPSGLPLRSALGHAVRAAHAALTTGGPRGLPLVSAAALGAQGCGAMVSVVYSWRDAFREQLGCEHAHCGRAAVRLICIAGCAWVVRTLVFVVQDERPVQRRRCMRRQTTSRGCLQEPMRSLTGAGVRRPSRCRCGPAGPL